MHYRKIIQHQWDLFVYLRSLEAPQKHTEQWDNARKMQTKNSKIMQRITTMIRRRKRRKIRETKTTHSNSENKFKT